MNIKQPVKIEYIYTWPDKRLRDGQNFMKAPLDYIVKSGVLEDDNYSIVTAENWRHLGVNKNGAGVEIIIRQVIE